VGGAAGAHIRKGDLLCTVDSEEALMRIAGRYIQYYRENAKYKERTYTFVERLGVERIRAIVVDDSDGIGEALDRELDQAAAATYDPWLERDAPATPNQFKRALKVIGS
jgi:nitrite reductase (NADH) large subunit